MRARNCYCWLHITDIDGNIRKTRPNVGAHELNSSINNDLSVEGISSLSLPLKAGLQDIRVVVRNNGANVITSANVSYK